MSDDKQRQIDVKNLRFYAEMFEQHQWSTIVIHWGVFKQTLNEIADRLDPPASGVGVDLGGMFLQGGYGFCAQGGAGKCRVCGNAGLVSTPEGWRCPYCKVRDVYPAKEKG